jgi:hypothetical protein
MPRDLVGRPTIWRHTLVNCAAKIDQPRRSRSSSSSTRVAMDREPAATPDQEPVVFGAFAQTYECSA